MKIDPIVEKFRPPTHYEIVTGKPYRSRIGKTKYFYQVNPLSATAMMRVYEIGFSIIKMLNSMAESKSKGSAGFDEKSVNLIQGLVALTSLLWEIGDKPRGLIKRILMKRQFFKQALDNTEWTFKLFEQVMSANARLNFFFETPGELSTNSRGTLSGDGFQAIIGNCERANQKAWAEYISIREAEKLSIINKWTVDKREHDKMKKRK
jgi:hypothetical protein